MPARSPCKIVSGKKRTQSWLIYYHKLKFDSFSAKFPTRNFSLREKDIVCRHSVISDSLFTTDHPYNHIWHAHLRLKKRKYLITMMFILVVVLMTMIRRMTIMKQTMTGHFLFAYLCCEQEHHYLMT